MKKMKYILVFIFFVAFSKSVYAASNCSKFNYTLKCGTYKKEEITCIFSDTKDSKGERSCNPNNGEGCSLSTAVATSRNDLEFTGWASKNEGRRLFKFVNCDNINDTLSAQWRLKSTASDSDSGSNNNNNNNGNNSSIPQSEPTENTTGAVCYACINTSGTGNNHAEWSNDGSNPCASGEGSIPVSVPQDRCDSSVFSSFSGNTDNGNDNPGGETTTENAACYYCSASKTYKYDLKSNIGNCDGSADKWTKLNVNESECKASDNASEQKKANIKHWYKITYNLDGGHFIDGSTSNRYQYLNDTEIIGEFKTNPIKDGYKFLYWVDSSGNEFDFNTKLSNDIILKAVYEKYEESKYYCENKNDVFDPSTALCYSVLKTYDDNEPFNNTTYRYKANEWMCYAYYGDVNNPGAISRIKGIPGTITGKNNKTDGVYEGYTSDSWRSKNTCLFGSPCTKDATRSGNVITWYKYDTECEVKWNTILYKVSDSVSNSDYNYYDDGSGGKQNKEADNSPKTGNAIVYLAWAAIIGACGYSIYYFKYRKEDESTTW